MVHIVATRRVSQIYPESGRSILLQASDSPNRNWAYTNARCPVKQPRVPRLCPPQVRFRYAKSARRRVEGERARREEWSQTCGGSPLFFFEGPCGIQTIETMVELM